MRKTQTKKEEERCDGINGCQRVGWGRLGSGILMVRKKEVRWGNKFGMSCVPYIIAGASRGMSDALRG